MARQARKQSVNGIYHVMLRGMNQQQIFKDEEDREKYLQIVRECKEISGFTLLAYCLMGNHIHLLLKEGTEPLGQIFKRIGTRFVYWYNVKYQRDGHLFHDRFKSEPIDDDEYLLTVLRHIHQEPVKAGICDRPEDYHDSSWREYLHSAWITDVSFMDSIIPHDALIAFHEQLGNEPCMDIKEKPEIRLTDEDAKIIIERITRCKSIDDFQGLTPIQRDKHIAKLRENHLALRQISRLTGVSLTVVRKAVEQHKEPSSTLETGEIVATHGIHGEVKLLPWADTPEFLLKFERIFIRDRWYDIQKSRIQKSCVLLKLKDVDTVEDAAKLIHAVAQIAREDVELDDGVHFIADLIGLTVLSEGEKIGVIKDVISMPGNDVYVVQGKYEYMIPVVREFVEEPDFSAGTVTVHLIEGMRTDEN